MIGHALYGFCQREASKPHRAIDRKLAATVAVCLAHPLLSYTWGRITILTTISSPLIIKMSLDVANSGKYDRARGRRSSGSVKITSSAQKIDPFWSVHSTKLNNSTL